MTETSKDRRCTAHSSRTGEKCRLPPIKGGTVCLVHGGSAPQVKNRALQRLTELVEPAIAELNRIMCDAGGPNPDAVKLAAAKDILDRAGFKPTDKIQLGGLEDGPALAIRIVRDSGEADAPKDE